MHCQPMIVSNQDTNHGQFFYVKIEDFRSGGADVLDFPLPSSTPSKLKAEEDLPLPFFSSFPPVVSEAAFFLFPLLFCSLNFSILLRVSSSSSS